MHDGKRSCTCIYACRLVMYLTRFTGIHKEWYSTIVKGLVETSEFLKIPLLSTCWSWSWSSVPLDIEHLSFQFHIDNQRYQQ